MGADLLAATYVTKSPYPDISDEERSDALKLAIESIPENVCQDLLENVDPSALDDDHDAHITLFDYAYAGMQDLFADYHRYHTPIARSGNYTVYIAGGVSYGDDPYDGWSNLCVFLDVLHNCKALADRFGVYANVNDFIKDRP